MNSIDPKGNQFIVDNAEKDLFFAEQAFLVLSREWMETSRNTPAEQCLSTQADALAMACLLLAVEWGADFTDNARSEMEANRAIAESRREPSWIDELPWRLCLASNIPQPPSDEPAVWELTTNLDHHNSSIRIWMMQLGWMVVPWIDPVEATVRLMKNLADTLCQPFMAAGLAARFFEIKGKPDRFLSFAKAVKPPDGFETQYHERLEQLKEQGTLAMQVGFWRSEALCRKEIERAAMACRSKPRSHKS